MAELALHVVGDGPAITWLHGYTMDSRIWQDVWRLLPGYRHIGVDLPGHGRSPALPASAPMSEWASGVERVMHQHDSHVLVAVCLGTMVAAEVAIRGRTPLSGLALIAPALVGMDEDLASANRFRSLAIRAMRGADQAELTELWLRPPSGMFAGMAERPDRMAALRTVIADHTWPDLKDFGPQAFRDRPQTVAELDGCGVDPILVVSGVHDMPAQRITALAMDDQLSSVQFAEFPDLGHLPILEEPGDVTPVLAEFLAGVVGNAAAA